MTSSSAHNHVRVVSLLTLVGGILGLIPSALALLAAIGIGLGGAFSGEPWGFLLAGGIIGFIALFLLVTGLPAVIAGFGLLARKPWARVLTIVIAVLNLFGFPIFTMLGAYQLWVLAMNEETIAAYQHPELSSTREYV
jgi:hypothetical protein